MLRNLRLTREDAVSMPGKHGRFLHSRRGRVSLGE
jgi:hypothetical protein